LLNHNNNNNQSETNPEIGGFLVSNRIDLSLTLQRNVFVAEKFMALNITHTHTHSRIFTDGKLIAAIVTRA